MGRSRVRASGICAPHGPFASILAGRVLAGTGAAVAGVQPQPAREPGQAVFEEAHGELLRAAEEAGSGAADEIAFLSRGFEEFLDAIVHPDVQRILITDAPAVLGLARFTELDERYAFPVLAGALRAVAAAGRLRAGQPETLARLLLGALTRAAMLIANSPEPAVTRDEVTATIRDMLAALAR